MFDVNNEINELIDTYNESVEIDYAMEAYNVIADELQNRVNSGELTLEDAEILNDMAYERYVNEGAFKKYRDIVYANRDEAYDAKRLAHKLTGSARTKAEERSTNKRNKYIKSRNNYKILTNGGYMSIDRENQALLNNSDKDNRDLYRDEMDQLSRHKEQFMKNTQGPDKKVINPNNESGRFIKKKNN